MSASQKAKKLYASQFDNKFYQNIKSMKSQGKEPVNT